MHYQEKIGILKKAVQAKEGANKGQIKEELELKIYEITIEERTNGRQLNMQTIVSKLPEKIKEDEEIRISLIGTEAEGTYKGKNFIIHENHEVIIDGDIVEKLTIMPNQIQKKEDGTNTIHTFPNLQIYNPKNEKANGVVIQFASAITQGDKIQMKDMQGREFINRDTYMYINTKGMSTNDIAKLLKNNLEIVIQKSNTIQNVALKISLTDQEMNVDRVLSFCSTTNHYYEFVAAPAITWTSAKVEAEKREYFGKKGYLATITSEEEDNFATSLIDGNGWLGGTCHYEHIYDQNGQRIYNSVAESVWNWYWVTGPEKGQKFYDRTGTLNKYTFWNPGEPNYSGSVEYFLHMLRGGRWNDFANNNTTITGYIVEYGDLPYGGIGEDELEGEDKASTQVFI